MDSLEELIRLPPYKHPPQSDGSKNRGLLADAPAPAQPEFRTATSALLTGWRFRTCSGPLLQVYLVPAASLQERGDPPHLSWKAVSTFAEIATPRTTFEATRVVEHLRKHDNSAPERVFHAANDHATELLAAQRRYAEAAGLPRSRSAGDALTSRLEEVLQRPGFCLLNIGWAGGFLDKAAFLDTCNEHHRRILRGLPLYERAIRTRISFPEARRLVFGGGQRLTLQAKRASKDAVD